MAIPNIYSPTQSLHSNPTQPCSTQALLLPSSLLLRQYNSIGEMMAALEKTYVISSNTKKDVETLWLCLSKVRALLPVQMSQEEEALMRELLW